MRNANIKSHLWDAIIFFLVDVSIFLLLKYILSIIMTNGKTGGKYVYGICTNNDNDGRGEPCPECLSKKKFRLSACREFVCPKCGQPLTKVSGSLPAVGLLIGIGAAVVAIVVLIVIYLVVSNDSDKSENSESDAEVTTEVSDVSAQTVLRDAADDVNVPDVEVPTAEEPQVVNEKTVENKEISKTVEINPSYGKYSGDRKNGKAHGFGNLTFTASKIVADGVYAEPGYKIRNGRFENGKLKSGTLYNEYGEKVCFIQGKNYILW